MLVADAGFQPYRNVLSNPSTLSPEESSGTNPITNQQTKAVAQLFSASYTTLLLILVKYYRFDETSDNQDGLQGAAKTMMMRIIAKLGKFLSTLPATADKNAGPPFEIYTLPSLPYERPASLKVLRERLGLEKAFAAGLVTQYPALSTLPAQFDLILSALPV